MYIKNILLCMLLSSSSAQIGGDGAPKKSEFADDEIVFIDSEKFQNAVDEAIMERVDFYSEGSDLALHDRLMSIEEEMLLELQKNFDIFEENLGDYNSAVELDRHLLENEMHEEYRPKVLEIVPDVAEKATQYIKDMEGESMPGALVEGHLGGVQYVFDR